MSNLAQLTDNLFDVVMLRVIRVVVKERKRIEADFDEVYYSLLFLNLNICQELLTLL